MKFSRQPGFSVTKLTFLLVVSFFCKCYLQALTLSGPITVSSVTVTGNVTVSTMTVSTLTVTGALLLEGNASGVIMQVKFSSVTTATSVNSTTFTAVSGISQSITLSNPSNYVRVSLTGNLSTIMDNDQPVYVTVLRDGVNLGDVSFGLSKVIPTVQSTTFTFIRPIGIQIVDAPGNTNNHIYQAYIRVSTAGQTVEFPYEGTGYLLLEEIAKGVSNIVTATPSRMTVRGPITANNVIASGDMFVSSITVTTLTVSNFLNTAQSTFTIPGIIPQIKFSSTTSQFNTTSSTFVAISGVNATLALSNSTNGVRISLSGILADSFSQKAWVSISRDGTVLVPDGLAIAQLQPSPVGITYIDYPGDTNVHTYNAVLRTGSSTTASFSLSHFLVEEITK